jgi:hypothetical protein
MKAENIALMSLFEYGKIRQANILRKYDKQKHKVEFNGGGKEIALRSLISDGNFPSPLQTALKLIF